MEKTKGVVNARVLDTIMKGRSLSNLKLAQRISRGSLFDPKLIATRIGSLRKRRTFLVDLAFLNKLEKALSLDEGALVKKVSFNNKQRMTEELNKETVGKSERLSKEKKEMFVVNATVLNDVMGKEGLSNIEIAEKVAVICGCRIQNASVKIGTLKNKKNLLADLTFIKALERVLLLAEGDLIIKQVSFRERRKKIKSGREIKEEVIQSLKEYTSRKEEVVLIPRNFLLKIKNLLEG